MNPCLPAPVCRLLGRGRNDEVRMTKQIRMTKPEWEAERESSHRWRFLLSPPAPAWWQAGARQVQTG